MKNNKYKILVLSDLKKSTKKTLQSSIGLAKIIDGDIEFFNVTKPSEVVYIESQLSAVRNINEQQAGTKKKIQNLIKPFSEDNSVKINYKYAFGNVKNEIERCIEDCKPDIIVLGKRKSKVISFIGDNVTDFVLNKFDGAVLIASNENVLDSEKELSLGLLNSIHRALGVDFAEDLLSHTKKPLTLFKIVKNSNTSEENEVPSDKKTIEYVFEQNDNTINNLSNYLLKNGINLLCVDRGNDETNKKINSINADVKDFIGKLDVSLLLTRR